MFDVPAETLITALISASVAVVALGVFLMLPARRARPAILPVTQPVFLFHDGQLTDATPEAEAFLPDDTAEQAGWADVARVLIPRFPGLPVAYADALSLAGARIGSALPQDSAELALDMAGTRLRLTLVQPPSTRAAAGQHARLMQQQFLGQVAGVATDLTYPIWAEDADGRLVWVNKTYETLARVLGKPSDAGQPETIFAVDPVALEAEGAVRASVGEGDNTR